MGTGLEEARDCYDDPIIAFMPTMCRYGRMLYPFLCIEQTGKGTNDDDYFFGIYPWYSKALSSIRNTSVTGYTVARGKRKSKAIAVRCFPSILGRNPSLLTPRGQAPNRLGCNIIPWSPRTRPETNENIETNFTSARPTARA